MPQHEITLRSPQGRLILIPPNAADDELHAKLRSHPITHKAMPYGPRTIEEARRIREKRAAQGVLSFFVHKLNPDGSSAFVGACGLHSIDEEHASAHVGIAISPDHHRGGIATEALYMLLRFGFEDRKFHRIAFETAADNDRMKGWLEKVVGAEQESKMRECWKTSEGYVDVVGYALLDWEWSGRIKAQLESRLHIEGKKASESRADNDIQGLDAQVSSVAL
ncbi:acyl-CoA N-acyltransferase [Athelia psychrophila]|uniref:Acyl-CoA N-acyltransferase n=1 Tax=Athelia psychrophila TaxID=1759441 RepID=A0A166NPE8_9AGAM|nr:acyl-CoA N-acyltransferase [Fibularhizoctonia sp. CBS 109695]